MLDVGIKVVTEAGYVTTIHECDVPEQKHGEEKKLEHSHSNTRFYPEGEECNKESSL